MEDNTKQATPAESFAVSHAGSLNLHMIFAAVSALASMICLIIVLFGIRTGALEMTMADVLALEIAKIVEAFADMEAGETAMNVVKALLWVIVAAEGVYFLCAVLRIAIKKWRLSYNLKQAKKIAAGKRPFVNTGYVRFFLSRILQLVFAIAVYFLYEYLVSSLLVGTGIDAVELFDTIIGVILVFAIVDYAFRSLADYFALRATKKYHEELAH